MSDADSISHAVLDKFDALPKKGKPISGSEWTVLAGFVLISNGTHECVAIGTGLKCCNKNQISHGCLNDSHAEIIAKRGLQLFLGAQCKLKNSKYVSNHGGKFKLNCDRLALYVSQAPCGDASTTMLLNSCTDTNISHRPAKKLKLDGFEGDVVRGRMDLSRLGVMRTKPGRIDCVSTNSMSCSDKILMWNVLGICGSLLSQIFHPVYINVLVVGHLYNEESIRKSLIGRLDGFDTCSDTYRVNRNMIVMQSSVPFKYSKNSKYRTDPSSIGWVLGFEVEVTVAGRRLGSSQKKGVWHPSSVSRLAKGNLWDACKENIKNGADYRSTKLLGTAYIDVKERLKLGPLKGWLGNVDQ